MAEIKIDIVVPSFKRAETITTHRMIDNAIVCIPESQADDYLKHNPGIVIETHPDTLLGLTLKRQWIIERHPNVFMIDDDVLSFNRLYVENGEQAKITPEEMYWIVQYIGNCAKMAGAYLFGINKNAKPVYYDEFSPVALSGVIQACIGVLEGSRLFFHEKATLTEDQWICGYNAFINRYCWIDKRFCCTYKKSLESFGGSQHIRNITAEIENTIWIRQMFGEAVEVVDVISNPKSMNMRRLNIPY